MDEKTLPVSSHSKIFEVVYLLLIFSLFLCLGNDRLEFLTFRMILGGVLLAGLFFLARSGGCGSPNKKGGSLALFFFGALIFFQFVRAFLAYYGLVTPNSAFSNNLPPAQFMLFVPVWCFCMGVFCLSFSFLWTKGRASHFLNALVFSAFFLAINFIFTLIVVAISIRGTH